MPSLKSRIRQTIVSNDDLRQWAPVALERDSTDVEITIESPGTPPRNVSHAMTVASLRPLLFAINDDAPSRGRSATVCLRSNGRLIGRVDCRPVQQLTPSVGPTLQILSVAAVHSNIAGWRTWAASAYRAYSQLRHRKQKDPYNFDMGGLELLALLMFYVRPRPVVLVSVADGDASNIFPMDLIGPVSPEHFTLALRSTSPATRLMRSSRQVALADVPAEKIAVAYELGKHHRKASIDWDALPFLTSTSSSFGLRVPDFALRIREMYIHDSYDVGSHVFFICSQVSCAERRRALQLHHTAGLYQAYCKRRGVGMQEASL